MLPIHRFIVPIVLLVSACGNEPEGNSPTTSTEPTDAGSSAAVTRDARPPEHLAPEDAAPKREPLAEDLVRREWARAENRTECAPLAFTDDGGAGGTARRANFAGGWAVAFDTKDHRSAYGLAGPGLTAADAASPATQAERLGRQWPYFTTLATLPPPAFAGYGVEGASAYPEDNPDGRGLPSLAYVRVGSQRCTYNVWSRISRAHLQVLLESLRPL